ncbi:MAG: hypothetical protein D6790_15240 [Caldilineae bacterium]|nr:MAG: hypothetical protein D6790_15240 [Caldilineae bacterium]
MGGGDQGGVGDWRVGGWEIGDWRLGDWRLGDWRLEIGRLRELGGLRESVQRRLDRNPSAASDPCKSA